MSRMIDEGGGTMESEPSSTNINRDLVDGGFRLRSPSEVACDIDAYTPDNTLKFCIIL